MSSVPSGGEVHSLTSSFFLSLSLFLLPLLKVLQFRSIPFVVFFFFLVLASTRQAPGTAELMASVLKSRGG